MLPRFIILPFLFRFGSMFYSDGFPSLQNLRRFPASKVPQKVLEKFAAPSLVKPAFPLLQTFYTTFGVQRLKYIRACWRSRPSTRKR